MKKTVAIILSAIIMCTLIFTITPSADDASSAGVKITKAIAETDTHITFAIEMKLPTSSAGVTAISTALSYDETVLTLVNIESDTTYTSNNSVVSVLTADTMTSPAIDVKLEAGTTNQLYEIADASIFSGTSETRSVLLVNLIAPFSTGTAYDPESTQGSATWQDVYHVRFKKSSATAVGGDSIRFVNSTDTTNLNGLGAAEPDFASFFDIQSTGAQYVHAPLIGQDTTSLNIMADTANGSVDYTDPPARVKGDVTGDNRVTSIDVAKIRSHISRPDLVVFSADDTYAADVTGDNRVTSIDVAKIRSHISRPDLVTLD